MLQAKRSHYEAVADALRKEHDRNPSVGEDWRDSTILSLGAVRGAALAQDQIVDAFHKHKPEMATGIEKTITSACPILKRLSEKSLRHWTFGIYLANFQTAGPAFTENAAEGAVVMFTKVIQLELKSRIFLRFREFVLTDENVKKALPPILSQRDPFLEFLKSKRSKITIGQMYFALDQCRSANTPIQVYFRDWVTKTSPKMLDRSALTALSRLPDISGEAKHGSTKIGDADSVQELGRQILEALI